jgi:hypothetical protein
MIQSKQLNETLELIGGVLARDIVLVTNVY